MIGAAGEFEALSTEALSTEALSTEALSTPEDVYSSWSATCSPSGRVAFVSDRTGEPAVWIRASVDDVAGPAPLPTPGLRVLSVSWSPDGAWLACWTAAAGSTRNEVWLVRPDGTGLHRVAGADPATALLGAGPRHGWTADGRLMVTETVGLESAALLLHPGTGARTVLASGPLLTLLDTDLTGRRALLRTGPRGSRRLAVTEPAAAGSGKLRPVELRPVELRPVELRPVELRPVDVGRGPGTADLGFLAPDGRTAFARSDVGRELAALVAADLEAEGPAMVVAGRADAELEDVVPSQDGRSAVLVWNVYGGTSEITLLDLATGRQRPVPTPRAVVGECRLLPDGVTGGPGRLVLTGEDWSDPRGVWAVDLATGRALAVSSPPESTLHASPGASTESVETSDLVEPRLVRLRAHDGLGLSGWLYEPVCAGPGPWPTAIHLHGGPEAQERPVYNSLFQSLVACGVAVFAPNVRGSSGFGRSFSSADDREKRYDAVRDVAACVTHLLDTGVAAPGRVACMGRSYGGYLTLAALTWHPELFAAGVDVCGMADFATFYAHTEPRIAAAAVPKYGHPEHDAALLHDLSPIHRIDRLTAPLLIVHGADDTNVPVVEAEQVAAALAARGVEHWLMIFPGEGHELLSTPNRVAFVQATLDWVVGHLCGS